MIDLFPMTLCARVLQWNPICQGLWITHISHHSIWGSAASPRTWIFCWTPWFWLSYDSDFAPPGGSIVFVFVAQKQPIRFILHLVDNVPAKINAKNGRGGGGFQQKKMTRRLGTRIVTAFYKVNFQMFARSSIHIIQSAREHIMRTAMRTTLSAIGHWASVCVAELAEVVFTVLLVAGFTFCCGGSV